MISTLEAILIGFVGAVTQILPISASAHQHLVQSITGWVQTDSITSVIYTCVSLALFIYYRHDWASIIASIFRVLLTFSKPMTIDERMPFFLVLSSAPPILIDHFELLPDFTSNIKPYWIAALLAVFTLPIFLAERMNRRNKCYLDWSFMDAIMVGIAQLTVFIPGAGRHFGFYTGAFFQNFQMEAAVKYSFLSFTPWLVYRAICMFPDSVTPIDSAFGMSPLSFGFMIIVTFFTATLTIGGFNRQVLKSGLTRYTIYRFLVAGTIYGLYWYQNR